MLEEQVFDLFDADVLAAAKDDVLAAATDRQVALGVAGSEITGAKPAVGSERLIAVLGR